VQLVHGLAPDIEVIDDLHVSRTQAPADEPEQL
jgi:hypothetical protein